MAPVELKGPIATTVAAYLTFLERDMNERPERLKPFTEVELTRILVLTKDVLVSDSEIIPAEITL